MSTYSFSATWWLYPIADMVVIKNLSIFFEVQFFAILDIGIKDIVE
jgi:hypothetical protein